MKQTIRIIGGQYRGKKLNFPTIDGLRPTPDRVRETLFNWLMHDVRNARCLDAFAGSGALGFEAYSRGAAQVVFVEKAAAAYKHLCQVAAGFNTTQLCVLQADACTYLQTTQAQFDIIFVDPPFAQSQLLDCIHTLTHSNVLAVGGLLYLETPQEMTLAPTHFEKLKLKRAGLVTYGLYRKIGDAA